MMNVWDQTVELVFCLIMGSSRISSYPTNTCTVLWSQYCHCCVAVVSDANTILPGYAAANKLLSDMIILMGLPHLYSAMTLQETDALDITDDAAIDESYRSAVTPTMTSRGS